jgi:predicted HAD superfamily Cof-like phosphohydrolase
MLKSETQLAAEFCMNAAGQKVRQRPATPSEAELKLRANLILEETFETIHALGCVIYNEMGHIVSLKSLELFARADRFNLIEVIDGICDLNVVAAGTMSCIGACDIPHMDAVNQANAAKFPHGVAVPHPTVPGKFGKPEGWAPPNHAMVLAALAADELEWSRIL